MRKLLQPWILIAAVVSSVIAVVAVPPSQVSATFAGGSGTSGDPWLISDCTQLQAIRDPASNLSKHFKLAANINCSTVSPFTPLSNSTTYFTGSLDGAGYEVQNLTISCVSTCGLFPTFKASTAVTIKDITFRDSSVTGTGSQIGTIVGTLNAPLTITNVEFINPTVSGTSNIGGVIGYFPSSSASSAQLTATDLTLRNPTISATTLRVGGLIGYADNYPAETLTVTRADIIGGTVTGDSDPALDNGTSYTGGFAGAVLSGTFSGGTMSATVSARESYVGGIAGQAGSSSTLSGYRKVYFNNLTVSGSVSTLSDTFSTSTTFRGNSYIGGVVGYALTANSLPRTSLPKVQNVTVSSPSISGQGSRVGGIFGWVSNYDIIDTKVTSNITGATHDMQEFDTTNNYYSADVGGFIGSTSGSDTYITGSSFSGQVSAPSATSPADDPDRDYVGGFVGWHRGTKLFIEKSYVQGTVTGDTHVGGFVGYSATRGMSLSITDSYVRADVMFNDGGRAGGLSTYGCSSDCTSSENVFKRSYFAGVLGGLPADRFAIVRNSATSCADTYFDSELSQTTVGSYWTSGTKYCRDSTSGATPLLTAQMKVANNFANWDFVNVWGIDPSINNGYPYLRITPGIDSVAPAAPNSPTLVSSSDSGVSTSDELTNDNTPEIRVVSQENGGTVTVTASRASASDVTCTMTGATSGGTCSLGTLSDGTWSIVAHHSDVSGNQSTSSSALSIVIDTTAPSIVNTSPAHNATGVSRRPTISIQFDEDVVATGGRSIRIRDFNAVQDVETIDGASSAITVSGDTALITPSVQINANTIYSVYIDYVPDIFGPTQGTGVFTDLAGNVFTGVVCCTAWQFTTTTDGTAPVGTWSTPTTPTASRTLQFGLSFSETVTGLSSDDLTNSGTATGCTPTVTGSGTTYTVDVTCTSTGTVILRLALDSVVDVNGNNGPSSSLNSATITIEDPAPAPAPATNPTPEDPTSPVTTTTVPPSSTNDSTPTTVPAGNDDEGDDGENSSPTTTAPMPEEQSDVEGSTSTTVPADLPVLDLDLDAAIVIKAGTTAVVFSGESIDRAAKSVGVKDGRVRIRPRNGNWQVAPLPNPPDLTVILNGATSLDVEFVPLAGETVRVSVPLEISINDGGVSSWLVALIAIASAFAGFMVFALYRRRRTTS